MYSAHHFWCPSCRCQTFATDHGGCLFCDTLLPGFVALHPPLPHLAGCPCKECQPRVRKSFCFGTTLPAKQPLLLIHEGRLMVVPPQGGLLGLRRRLLAK